MTQYHELKRAAKQARFYAGQRWRAVAGEIWSGSDILGRMVDHRTAEFICQMQNTFLPFYNRVVMMVRRWKDEKDYKGDE